MFAYLLELAGPGCLPHLLEFPLLMEVVPLIEETVIHYKFTSLVLARFFPLNPSMGFTKSKLRSRILLQSEQ
jgi:hypothetical protein